MDGFNLSVIVVEFDLVAGEREDNSDTVPETSRIGRALRYDGNEVYLCRQDIRGCDNKIVNWRRFSQFWKPARRFCIQRY